MTPFPFLAGSGRSTARRGATALLALSLLAGAGLTGCASAEQSTTGAGDSAFSQAPQDAAAPITVWTDSTRLDAVKQYQAANPGVKMDVVSYDGGADGSTYLQTKVQLFDRTGKGWPDVVFGAPVDATWATRSTGGSAQSFAAPLDTLMDKDTLGNFASGSLTPCEAGGHTYCLRNDIAQSVLWYNKKLMDEFGYKVPTTWEEYEALGQKVAAEHPGYLIGAIGDSNAHESYFWGSKCPAVEETAKDALRVDLADKNCTRMAGMLDNLIKAGSVSTDAFFGKSFAAEKGAKVLMAYGPSWYGKYLFDSSFKAPAGTITAALAPKWEGDAEPATGNVGGGIWMVSSHSTNLKASTDLATWLTTSNDYQAKAPTYPAYAPAAKAWLANPENSKYFATDISGVFTSAAGMVWKDWANTRFSTQSSWASVMLPALTGGKTITETLPAWQQALTDEAKSVGYQVSNK